MKGNFKNKIQFLSDQQNEDTTIILFGIFFRQLLVRKFKKQKELFENIICYYYYTLYIQLILPNRYLLQKTPKLRNASNDIHLSALNITNVSNTIRCREHTHIYHT